MTICWAMLAFVCMGEEIRRGQRIFNFSTPEVVKEDDVQGEFNLHNMAFMDDDVLGGKYRFISVYLLLGGLGIPLAARTKWGKSLAKSTYFPVLPWCYSSLWVGAYIYGKYYFAWHPVPHLVPKDAATEIRELMMGVGTAFFGIHALSLAIGSLCDPAGRGGRQRGPRRRFVGDRLTVTDVLHELQSGCRPSHPPGGWPSRRASACGPPIPLTGHTERRRGSPSPRSRLSRS